MAKLVFPRAGFWAVKQRGELVSTLRPADGQIAVAVRRSFSEGSFPLLLYHFLSLPPPLIPLEILSAGIFSLCHSYLMNCSHWTLLLGTFVHKFSPSSWQKHQGTVGANFCLHVSQLPRTQEIIPELGYYQAHVKGPYSPKGKAETAALWAQVKRTASRKVDWHLQLGWISINPTDTVLVTQSCLILRVQGCRPPGSYVHGILHKNTGVGWHDLLQGIFPT